VDVTIKRISDRHKYMVPRYLVDTESCITPKPLSKRPRKQYTKQKVDGFGTLEFNTHSSVGREAKLKAKAAARMALELEEFEETPPLMTFEIVDLRQNREGYNIGRDQPISDLLVRMGYAEIFENLVLKGEDVREFRHFDVFSSLDAEQTYYVKESLFIMLSF